MSHSQVSISQEADRVAPVTTLGITAWVVGFGCLLSGAAYGVLSLRASELPHAATTRQGPPVATEVQGVRTELFRGTGAGERLKQRQRDALQQYHWVDRAQGLVQIPIDVAMELELEAQTEPEAKP